MRGEDCSILVQLTQRLLPSNNDLDVDYNGNSRSF